jgi:hypothetical protein
MLLQVKREIVSFARMAFPAITQQIKCFYLAYIRR